MIRVVLPTDFSENAFHAISHAVKLLENSTCIFYLVHAYTPPVYRVDYTLGSPGQLGLPDDERYRAEEALEKTRKRIKEQFHVSKHTFVIHAAFNSLVDEIDSIAQKENVDFIVMGTQGATGAKEILFGSNTVHVIQKTGIPVLAVPSEFEYRPPENILFPTDYEVDYNKANLDFLLKFSKLEHSKLHIMHVTSPEGLDSDQMGHKTFLEGKLLEHNHEFHDLPDQDLIEAINQFQKETPVELLAMVKNKHTFLERLFVEPIIKNIGLHSKVPFLVLPFNQ
ncbi:universal stress protein [Muricauda sp. 334s03]|uniref:Universal stress protein n=1 Tax=Flagellimonas yonaguniensis TaxID=3031325 RepID=A0ABT5Y3L5_9FLAO|nr:universal stress protein [[Muricauda] yonaguniensis]MDF0717929.1 universal stress protein [[Muricauda] yonaguniensis]